MALKERGCTLEARKGDQFSPSATYNPTQDEDSPGGGAMNPIHGNNGQFPVNHQLITQDNANSRSCAEDG
jgi:hypothetical protein